MNFTVTDAQLEHLKELLSEYEDAWRSLLALSAVTQSELFTRKEIFAPSALLNEKLQSANKGLRWFIEDIEAQPAERKAVLKAREDGEQGKKDGDEINR